MLEPLGFDPFEGTAPPAAPKLVPLDVDPFSGETDTGPLTQGEWEGNQVPEEQPVALPHPEKPEADWLDIAKSNVSDLWSGAKGVAGGALQFLSTGLDELPRANLKTGQFEVPPSEKAAADARVASGQPNALERLADLGGKTYQAAQQEISDAAPNVDPNTIKGWASTIGKTVMNVAPYVALSFVPGGEAMTIPALSVQIGGEKYGAARAAGQTHEQASGESGVLTALNVLTLKVPINVITQAGGDLWQKVINGGATFAAQSGVVTAIEQAYQAKKQSLQDGSSFVDAWNKLGGWDNVKRETLSGAAAGGFLGAGHHALESVLPGQAPPPKPRIEPTIGEPGGEGGPPGPSGGGPGPTLSAGDRASPLPDATIAEGKAYIDSIAPGSVPARTILGENPDPISDPAGALNSTTGARLIDEVLGSQKPAEAQAAPPAPEAQPIGTGPEVERAAVPVDTIKAAVHQAADGAGIPWDHDPQFMAWTKQLTGKDRLDHMDAQELGQVLAAIKSGAKPSDGFPPSTSEARPAARDSLPSTPPADRLRALSVDDMHAVAQKLSIGVSPNPRMREDAIATIMAGRTPTEIGRALEGLGQRPDVGNTESPAVANQVKTPKEEAGLKPLMRKDGQPFATAAEAKMAAKQKSFIQDNGKGWKATKIEGGYGLRQAQPRGPRATKVGESASGTDALTYLAARGGIRDDEGHDLLKGRDLQRMTQAGPLIRKTGMSIDEAGRVLHEGGYFGPIDEKANAGEKGGRPTEDAALAMIERAHKTKTYLPEEQHDIEANIQEARGDEGMIQAKDQIAAVAKDHDLHLSDKDISAILDDMAEHGLEAEDAVISHIERFGAETLHEVAKATGDETYADIPGMEFGPAEGNRPAQPGEQGPARAAGTPGEGSPRGPPPEKGAEEEVGAKETPPAASAQNKAIGDQHPDRGKDPEHAYASVSDVNAAIADGTLKENPEQAGLCYKFAARKAMHGAGEYVIGLVGPERMWHAITDDGAGRYYDPQYDRWFTKKAYEDAVGGFEPVHRMSAREVMRFGGETGKFPDPSTLSLEKPAAAKHALPETEKVTVYDEKDQPVQADHYVVPGAEKSEAQAKAQTKAQQKAEVELRAKQSKMRTSAPQKEGGGLFGPEKGEQGGLFALRDEDEEKDLIAQHNTTGAKLLHSERMGGIAVPSLAITKVEHPIHGYGDISLIGHKDMANPQSSSKPKVFGSDVYSPRYPQVVYRVTGDALKKLNELLRPYDKEDRPIYGDQISRPDDLVSNKDFQAYATKKLGDNAGFHELKALAETTLRDVGAQERLFQGFTNAGTRRYKAHTIDNVVAELKKGLRGGEGFNYGVGSLRAHFSPQFKTVAQIRKARGRLLDKANFAKVKDEIDKEFWEVAKQLAPYSDRGESFGFGETVIGIMEDAAKMGVPRALKEYGLEDAGEGAQRAVAEFMGKLRDLPTEYFEAKILRPVGIHEFAGAVVPHDTTPEVRALLAKRGVETFDYRRGDEEDRKRAIKEAADHLGDRAKFSIPEKAPTFYSALTRSIEGVAQPKAPPGQWNGIIDKLPGVKKEEIEWSGVKDWLASQTKPVTKDELLGYLRANELQVQETTLGGPHRDDIRPDLKAQEDHKEAFDKAGAEYQEANKLSGDRLYRRVQGDDRLKLPDGYKVVERDTIDGKRYAVRDSQGNDIAMHTTADQAVGQALERIAHEATVRQGGVHASMIDDTMQRAGISGKRAKFGTYTLPGGENYREILLRLPPAPVDLPPRPEPMTELPAGYVHTFNRTEPPEKQWAVLPPGQEHGRPFAGTWPDEEQAATAALKRLNDEQESHWQSATREARKAGNFTEGHFNEPNVVAHIRFKDRTDLDGKKVLFVEEIQSDWHQKGRRRGYQSPNTDEWTAQPLGGEHAGYWGVYDAGGQEIALVGTSHAKTPEAAIAEAAKHEKFKNGVPDAPFKTTWPELAFKRALRYAAENGYDRVGWTTGEQQADRYDLSHHVSRIEYDRVEGSDGVKYNVAVYDRNGRAIPDLESEGMWSIEEVEENLGKGIADQIASNAGDPLPDSETAHNPHAETWKQLTGLNLKVGGEGMRGFYDKMLPSFANKLGKKWGAKVGETTIDTGEAKEPTWETTDDGGVGKQIVHSIDVTPAMREGVMEGQPLFRLRPEFGDEVTTKLKGSLEAQLKKMDPRGRFAMRLVEDLQAFANGKARPADGRYLRGLIEVSLNAKSPDAVLGHELVHGFREKGLIKEAEWTKLKQAALADPALAKTRARYAERKLTEEQVLEEHVADMFGKWRTGETAPKGFIRDAFERVWAYIKSVGAALRASGYRNINDIFEGIERGHIGERDLGGGSDRIEPSYAEAWHGTPHDFDEFDASKIGTGEGAQAYGHGFYFADKRTVAEFYRNKLTKTGETYLKGQLIDRGTFLGAGLRTMFSEMRGGKSFEAARNVVADDYNFRSKHEAGRGNGAQADEAHEASETIRGLKDGEVELRRGRLFKVELAPGDDEWLDWDKPLAKQSDKVKEALGKLPEELWQALAEHMEDSDHNPIEGPDDETYTGGELYNALRTMDNREGRVGEFLEPTKENDEIYGNAKAVSSQLLKESGIPGIRYFDGGSRGAGEGTSNYVVFDPKHISVQEKFALTPEEGDETQATAPDGEKARGRAMAHGFNFSQPIDRVMRLPFDLFGGVDDRGQWRPGQYLYDKAAHFITDAKFSSEAPAPFQWLNGIMYKARAGLIDRYGLPEDYVKREKQRTLDERHILMKAPELMTGLKDMAPDEAAVLQKVLTGEEIGDAEMQRLAEPIRDAIDTMGQEAVSLGLASAESVERNRGKYLHRVYKKYEGEENSLVRWINKVMGSQRKQIIGEQFKGRGMWNDVAKTQLETPDRAAQKGDRFIMFDLKPGEGQGTLADIDPGTQAKTLRREYVRADEPMPPKYATWSNRGEWEVRGMKGGKAILWRDFTPEERSKMGEIVDARYTVAKTYLAMAHDLATGRFYKDIATNEAWSQEAPPDAPWKDAAEYGRFNPDPSVQWVRVPDTTISKSNTKKYAALAGRFVRADIWRDLQELDRMQKSTVWDSLLRQWKLNKTARSPVVHMNNVVSNFMLMDLADVSALHLAKGVRSLVKRDPMYLEAVDHGALGSDMIQADIHKDVLAPALKDIMGASLDERGPVEARFGTAGKVADAIWGGFNALDRKLIDAYHIEDEVFRMALYHKEREAGTPAPEAAEAARQQFIDYDIRAPWINAARRSVLPFLSFTYRAAPLVAKAIATRPWKLAKYALIANAMSALGYQLFAGDEKKERRLMDPEKQGYTWVGAPRMIRMAWGDSYGAPVYLDIRRWIPAGDVFDTDQGQISLPGPIQWGGPLQLAAELNLNRSAFTGKDIVNRDVDTPWEQAKGYADYLYKSWMPSAAWIPGSWYWSKIGSTWQAPDVLRNAWETMGFNPDRARDIAGHLYDPLTATLSSFGIKLTPEDLRTAEALRALQFKKTEDKLEEQARGLARDRDRGQISEKEFNRGMAGVMEKVTALAGKERKTLQGGDE